MTKPNRQKIIIDTDPGIDDAIALCYAMAHPNLEVVALTSIFGNVSAQLGADNALRLCDLTGHSIPVAKGADVPRAINPRPVADFVHGSNGFGNINLPEPSRHATSISAAELIVEKVSESPGEITLVPVGPLTNLALALDIAPEIADKVKEVVVMGGVFFSKGNVTPHAEANIWNDPHAAQRVLTADWPVVMHGLDITYQITFDRNYLDKLAQATPIVGGFLRDAADFYIKFYEENHNIKGCCPHDLLAVAYAANPQWFNTEAGVLDVVTSGEEIGRTTTSASAGSPNKAVATKVDRDALLHDYLQVLATYS